MIRPEELVDAARDGLAGGVGAADGGVCAARVSLWAEGRCVAQAEASADDTLSAVRAAAAEISCDSRIGKSCS